MKNEDIFKSEEFRKACESHLKKEADKYPDSTDTPHKFSEEFENKMDELFEISHPKKPKKFGTVGKRVAVIVAVTVLAMTTAAFGVKALRIPILEFFSRVYQEFTSLFISTEDTEYDDGFEFEANIPGHIVSGFEEEDRYKKINMMRIDYTSEDGLHYYFKQDRLYQNQMLDTEQQSYTDLIEANGVKYYFYETDSMNKLVWYDSRYSYLVSGNITKEEMLAVAQSVEKIY